MRRGHRRVYFRRYLAFSLLTLMIPMLTLGGALFGALVWREYDRSVRTADESIELLTSNLDTLFGEFDNIALQMRLNGLFQLRNQRTALDMRRAISELSTYSIANHNIRELLVWVEGFRYLLSSRSSYLPNMFSGGVYQFERWDEGAMLADFTDGKDGLSPPELMTASGIRQRILRYRKTIYSSIGKRAVAYFFIDENTLRTLLGEGAILQGGGNVLLMDADHNLILSASDASYITDEAFVAMAAEVSAGANQDLRRAHIGGAGYIVRAGQRTVRGNTVIAIIPERALMAEAIWVITLWAIGMAATLAVGAALITVFMRKNYRPIETLQKLAARYAASSREPEDELAVVHEAIESLGSSNSTLIERIEGSKPAVRDWALANLLSGNVTDITAFNQSYRQVGLSFSGAFILIACLDVESADTDNTRTKRLAMKWLTEHAGAECYFYLPIQENSLYMAASVDDGGAAFATRYVGDMIAELRQAMGVNVRAGLALPRGNASQTRDAYIEAFVAKEYLSMTSDRDIILYGDVIDNYENILLYPNSRIESFNHALGEGDEDETIRRLDELFAEVRQSSIPLFAVRNICYTIINMLLTAHYSARKTYAERLPRLDIDVTRLTEFRSVDELTRVTKQHVHDMLGLIREAQRGVRDDEWQCVIDAVDAACLDEQFSLQQIADRFDTPLSTLSAHFKARMGVPPLTYVTRMRMERAKTLLRTTNMPVVSIAQQVGYVDASNFTRKFRTEVGEPPGEYRKRFGENPNSQGGK